MAEKSTNTFKLNDEAVVNSYGFKVKTAGISLGRFNTNPVMLDSHDNSNKAVLGSWQDVRVDGGVLLADAVFDEGCDNAKLVQGKVERGFIKGCSMGLGFNWDDLKQHGEELVLEKCELMEASICAVPSNAGALKLYVDGARISESQVQAHLSALGEKKVKNLKTDMGLILTVAALSALGLQSADNAEAVSAAIVNLQNENTGLKQANQKLAAEAKAASEANAKALVNEAVLSGKITESERDEYQAAALDNYSLTAKLLGKLQGRQTLGAVNNPARPGAVHTAEDFQKLTHQEQMAFKAANPDAYKELFK